MQRSEMRGGSRLPKAPPRKTREAPIAGAVGFVRGVTREAGSKPSTCVRRRNAARGENPVHGVHAVRLRASTRAIHRQARANAHCRRRRSHDRLPRDGRSRAAPANAGTSMSSGDSRPPTLRTSPSVPGQPQCLPSNDALSRRRKSAPRAIGRSLGARSGSATGSMCATARMRVADAGPSSRQRRTATPSAARRAIRRTKGNQPPCDHCRQSAPPFSPFP